MATYVIGDVHGCYDELLKLLDIVNFDDSSDKLLFTGDLVNGGPKSIETLTFIKSLGKQATSVLGNHDLTLLALSESGLEEAKTDNGLVKILQDSRAKELLAWLKTLPLAYYDTDFNFLMVHAGLYPFWSKEELLALANEAEKVISSDLSKDFFANMFGNQPVKWEEGLAHWNRIRFIVNACTRMRFCSDEGFLELKTKGTVKNVPEGFKPWFEINNSKIDKQLRIIFGHWSALQGNTNSDKIIGLDTGCIWGNSLSALRLDDNKLFKTQCPQYCKF